MRFGTTSRTPRRASTTASIEHPGSFARDRSLEMSDLVCGEIASLEPVEGKDKLKKLFVKVSDDADAEAHVIVTNAPNVEVGKRLVVVLAGGTLRDGTEVRKTTVGGVLSVGMVCDSTMCGWSGGGAGTAALLPLDFPLGAPAPSSRLRLDGKNDDEGTDDAVKKAQAKEVEKAAKKAVLAAKRAARDAARAAKKAGGEDAGENEAEGEDAG